MLIAPSEPHSSTYGFFCCHDLRPTPSPLQTTARRHRLEPIALTTLGCRDVVVGDRSSCGNRFGCLRVSTINCTTTSYHLNLRSFEDEDEDGSDFDTKSTYITTEDMFRYN
ncbi:hypothetical protein E3N88_20550 [Mikania micrantha]|uniref:Uncharacterized protein n=1 Tax=Mikania micrantha TaxID=192012 RepID=A0A5N6NJT2_9ASTR|nr:hypothetical protein E3N88_20550 [Mikania micrantha]